MSADLFRSYPSLAIGDYSLGVTDGHGQWFGIRLDRFEPNRAEARSVRPILCFAGPWFRITYHRSEFGIYYVNREPRVWQRLRWKWQAFTQRLRMAP